MMNTLKVLFRAAVGCFLTFALLAGLSACSMMKKKVDPSREYIGEKGKFVFKFAMQGEWYEGAWSPGNYTMGTAPSPEGGTQLAVVRHGPLTTPGGKDMTNKEMIEVFQKQIELADKQGRVTKIKNEFTPKKYKNADCLYYRQTGEDPTPKGSMALVNEGRICLHPIHKYYFIWMILSDRRPLGVAANSSFAENKNRFFDSLEFKE